MSATLRRTTFWLLWLVVLFAAWQGSVVSTFGTPARLIGLLGAAVGGLNMLLFGRRHRWVDAHVAVLLFVGWAMLSTLWSTQSATTFTYAMTLVQLAVLLVFIWEYADEPGDVQRLMTAFVIGCSLSALSVILTTHGTAGEQRFTANGFNENDLGTTLALAVPMAWYLAARSTRALSTAAYSSYLVLGTLGVLLTGSRGSLFVLAVGLLVVPLGLRGAGPRARRTMFGALLVGAVATFLVVPAGTAARLDSIPSAITGSDLSGRVPLWKASMTIIEAHPVVGVGGGATAVAIDRLISVELSPHNTFLSVAAGLGAVGLTLFVGILLLVGHRTSGLPARERLFTRVLLASLLIGLLPLHWEMQKPVWIVFATVLGIARQAATVPVLVPVTPVPRLVRSFA